MKKIRTNLAVNLTENTLEAFLKVCLCAGLTPAQVLEGFINDLSSGDESAGSDEREKAKHG